MRRLASIAVFLALITVLFLGSSEFIGGHRDDRGSEPPSQIASPGSGNAHHSAEPGWSANSKRVERANFPQRAAKGTISSVNPAWGFAVVRDLDGSPQAGDDAYVARAGPDGGLMTVEAVDDGAAILGLQELDASVISAGNGIETMPSEIAEPRR
jgi:hypothetical protein